VSYTNWKPQIEGRTLEKCHNLYVDERGIVYLAGCNVNQGGVVMVDVYSQPGQPQLIGPATREYAHDVYVQDGVLYASEIYSGELGIYDVKDVDAPSIVSLAATPFRFTHNAWASTDGQTVFTTDERANAPVGAFDISNPGNARLVDEFRPLASVGQGVVPHNVHVIDQWLAISYYTDGAVIVDAGRPENLIEVGHFDTSPDFDSGFHGAWGAYPFLPSGLLLIADIETGLFVLRPDYVKACYLEGKVTDKSNGQSLSKVRVEIEADQLNQTATDPFGDYKTGIAEAGAFKVTFSKTGYFTEEVEVQLKNGILTELNVQLRPKRTYAFSGLVMDDIDESGIPQAKLMFVSQDTSYQLTAGAQGEFNAAALYEGNYTVYAGAWGYQQKVIGQFSFTSDRNLTVALEAGYEDDFVLDLGWQSTGNVSTGYWERGNPIGTKLGNRLANPDRDIEGDLGDMAYVTGNGGGDAGNDDVDDGAVYLQSKVIDLSQIPFPRLSFHYWFYNGGGELPINDTLKIYIANIQDTVLLHQETGTTLNEWQYAEFGLDSLIDTDMPLFMYLTVSDLSESGHIVEAGFDGFRITSDLISTSTSDEEAEPSAILRAYPNPFHEQVTLVLQPADIERERRLVIFNALGQEVLNRALDPSRVMFEWTTDQPAGLYFVHLFDGDRPVGRRKVIKE